MKVSKLTIQFLPDALLLWCNQLNYSEKGFRNQKYSAKVCRETDNGR